MTKLLAWLCLFLGLLAPALAAQEIERVEKASPLRRVLLDAARPIFETETGGPIEFVVTVLTVAGDWAYGDVKLQRPGGSPLDWSMTKFAEDLRLGMFEPEHNLFLLKNGGTGWRVIEYAVGPTDIAWDGWRQQYNLPAALFQY